MKTYELDFPIKHPKYVIEDKVYEKKLMQLMGRTITSGYLISLEGFYLRHIKYFNFKKSLNTFKRIFHLNLFFLIYTLP
jgi:hypothetical protein